METVLVVGASGNIGVSAIIAALRSNQHVLAVVRNKAAEDRVLQHVEAYGGTTSNITFAQADILKEDGVKTVVQQVRDGKLPAFQHVFAAIGTLHHPDALHNVDMDEFHHIFAVNFFADYYAYRATMPYLLEQRSPKSTWTFCTGGGGDNGYAGVTSIAQGALFSMAAVICHEKISVRFNELYLCYRVDYDSICEELGKENRMSASEFSGVYQTILANPDIRDCRVSVFSPKDVGELKYAKKLAAFQ